MSDTLLVHVHLSLTDGERTKLDEAHEQGPAVYAQQAVTVAERVLGRVDRIEVIAAEQV